MARTCVTIDANEPHQLRVDLSRVADQANGERLLLVACLAYLVQRLVQRACHLIAVSGIQAALNMAGIHLDSEADALIHRDSQGLRTAHAA